MMNDIFFKNLRRELVALSKEGEEYPTGAYKAYNAWVVSKDKYDVLVLSDFLWDREVDGFMDTLREAGIKEFIYASKSTAATENIYDLVDKGFEVVGVVKLTYDNGLYVEENKGIKIAVK